MPSHLSECRTYLSAMISMLESPAHTQFCVALVGEHSSPSTRADACAAQIRLTLDVQRSTFNIYHPPQPAGIQVSRESNHLYSVTRNARTLHCHPCRHRHRYYSVPLFPHRVRFCST